MKEQTLNEKMQVLLDTAWQGINQKPLFSAYLAEMILELYQEVIGTENMDEISQSKQYYEEALALKNFLGMPYKISRHPVII